MKRAWENLHFSRWSVALWGLGGGQGNSLDLGGGKVAMIFKRKLSNSEWNVRNVTVPHSTQHGSIVSEQNSNDMQEIIKAKQSELTRIKFEQKEQESYANPWGESSSGITHKIIIFIVSLLIMFVSKCHLTLQTTASLSHSNSQRIHCHFGI